MRTALALRAQALWKQAEQHTGYELLNQCGGIIVNNDTGGSFNNTGNYFAQTLEAAANFAIPHEIWDNKTAAQKYPQFHFNEGETIYYERASGFSRPEVCIDAHLELARASGAEIRQNTGLLGIEETSRGLLLETSGESMRKPLTRQPIILAHARMTN